MIMITIYVSAGRGVIRLWIPWNIIFLRKGVWFKIKAVTRLLLKMSIDDDEHSPSSGWRFASYLTKKIQRINMCNQQTTTKRYIEGTFRGIKWVGKVINIFATSTLLYNKPMNIPSWAFLCEWNTPTAEIYRPIVFVRRSVKGNRFFVLLLRSQT